MLTIKNLVPPAERQGGRLVESVDELISVLQTESKVL
jgi:hypothetical protein